MNRYWCYFRCVNEEQELGLSKYGDGCVQLFAYVPDSTIYVDPLSFKVNLCLCALQCLCVCVRARTCFFFFSCRLLERITSFKEYEIQHLLKSDTVWHRFEAMKVRSERRRSSFLRTESWVYVIASRPVKFPLKRRAPEGETKLPLKAFFTCGFFYDSERTLLMAITLLSRLIAWNLVWISGQQVDIIVVVELFAT